MQTRTVHVVKSDDFDEAVRKHFGAKDYEFVANEEASNGTSFLVTAEDDYNIDSYFLDLLNKWQSRTDYYAPGPQVLLGIMVSDHVIPAGDYLITVNW